MFCLIILLHQPQTVALTNKSNLLMSIYMNRLIEICECVLVMLQLQIKLSPVYIRLVVFWIISYAKVQLNKGKITIYSVSWNLSVFL